MSDSVWPHTREATRLPRCWDSSGKNNGVGCHFLLQCMKMKSESEVIQSCPTPRDPMDCTYQAPPVLGFSRQESWSGSPVPSPHDVCGSPLILEGTPILTGPKQETVSMTWAFLHSSPSHLWSMSQESHSIPPHIVHCSFYDPGWVTPFPLYSGDFSIGLSCRIRLWVRFCSKVCASQLAFLKLLFFPLLKYK